MPSENLDQSRLTPEQRLDRIAALLGRGVVRVLLGVRPDPDDLPLDHLGLPPEIAERTALLRAHGRAVMGSNRNRSLDESAPEGGTR